MAIELNIMTLAFKAENDLSAKQFHFVELSAVGQVDVCDSTTDIPIGVLQNAPAAGETAEVMIIGVSKVSADVDLALNQIITTSADGQAAVAVAGTDTTRYVLGHVIEENTAAGGLVTALINCCNPCRAA